MHVLLVPIGSVGDVNPYLAVGSTLRRRGHRVTVITNSFFEPVVRELDLEFVALAPAEELEAYWRDTDMWSATKYWKVSLDYCALRPMRKTYEIIAEYYQPGETVVAGPGWAFGARIAQEKLGVPLATLHLEPYWIRSLHHTSVMPSPMVTADWVPRISKRFQFYLADLVVDRFLAGPTNSFRRELGLPPVRRFLADWWHSPQRVIGLFPDWFFPRQPDWPAQTVLTGFPLWDRGAVCDVPEEVTRFLDEGMPPLVFTPGTPNLQADRFFRAAVEGCRLLGRRGILLTKRPEQLPRPLPEGVRHFEYIPFSHLLPRAAAVVHHAGTGTAAQCLAAGIPQVVMPMAYDQPDIADCLVRLGVARSLKPKVFRPATFARAVEDLLGSPQVARRCRELATKFEGVQPIEQTCGLLEDLAAGGN